MKHEMKYIPPHVREQIKNIIICSKCGDTLRGHEDESATHCRWCVTGWTPCVEEELEKNQHNDTHE